MIGFYEREKDGTPFLSIEDGTGHLSYGYYSNNSWASDDALVISRSDDVRDFKGCPLYLADLGEKRAEPLGVSAEGFSEYVVSGDKLYLIRDGALYRHGIATGETELLYREKGMGFPHMTLDGRYINWAGKDGDLFAGRVMDLSTGRVETRFRKRFAEPFPVANHMMISPTDPDRVFFSHEGITYYISNRLWLSERGKEPRDLAKQKLNATGDLGDCLGHECWAFDGKGLWFVKYPCSPEPPRGIGYFDLAKNDWEVKFSAYKYWHVAASPAGRYLGSDTQDGSFSGVCLIDLETGREEMLLKAETNWEHPDHPHPHFSPRDSRLAFHNLVDGRVEIGVIDLGERKKR